MLVTILLMGLNFSQPTLFEIVNELYQNNE